MEREQRDVVVVVARCVFLVGVTATEQAGKSFVVGFSLTLPPTTTGKTRDTVPR